MQDGKIYEDVEPVGYERASRWLLHKTIGRHSRENKEAREAGLEQQRHPFWLNLLSFEESALRSTAE